MLLVALRPLQEIGDVVCEEDDTVAGTAVVGDLSSGGHAAELLLAVELGQLSNLLGRVPPEPRLTLHGHRVRIEATKAPRLPSADGAFSCPTGGSGTCSGGPSDGTSTRCGHQPSGRAAGGGAGAAGAHGLDLGGELVVGDRAGGLDSDVLKLLGGSGVLCGLLRFCRLGGLRGVRRCPAGP